MRTLLNNDKTIKQLIKQICNQDIDENIILKQRDEELKRLYMPENWEGHPLKKDYKEADERLKWND